MLMDFAAIIGATLFWARTGAVNHIRNHHPYYWRFGSTYLWQTFG